MWILDRINTLYLQSRISMGDFFTICLLFMVLSGTNSIPQGYENDLSFSHRSRRQAPEEDQSANSPACGSTLAAGRDGSGVIEPSRINDTYLRDHSCTWVIQAVSSARILIASKDFAVEMSHSCIWDYLEVRDGEDDPAATVDRFCGYKPVSYISTTNVLYLHFVTDGDYQDFGFVLEYSASPPADEIPNSKCNALVTAPAEGFVSSPNYPSNYEMNTHCYYRIQAPSGMVVNFQVADLDLSSYEFDHVLIYDGNNSRSTMVWSSNGEDNTVWPLRSTDRDLFVHFQAGYFETTRGFKLTYNFVLDTFTRSTPPSTTPSLIGGDSDCSGVIELGEPGVLTSPLHPDLYPNNKLCRWEIRCVDPSLRVELNFTTFSLEHSDNCTYDYLQVYWDFSADEQESNKYCFEDLQDKVIMSRGAKFRLEFVTDESISNQGFEIHYQSVGTTSGNCDPSCIDDEVCVSDDTGEHFCFPGRLCDANDCLNGGTCVEDDTFPECYCALGFSGELCEDAVSTEPLVFLNLQPYIHRKVPEGESVVFDCGIEDPGTAYNLMWLFDDRILLDEEEGVIEVHEGGVLMINHFTEAYRGNYTCLATTKYRSAEAHVYLEFVQDCALQVLTRPTDKVVKTGKIALMECYVPDATRQTWSKQSLDGVHQTIIYSNRISMMSNGYLKIMNATVGDSGRYSCSSESDYGCHVTQSGRLKVIESVAVRDVCGKDKISRWEVKTKITNGKTAKLGSTPWHVIFNNITGHSKNAFCGGSLISDKWIVTAGHCIAQFTAEFTNDNVELYLGTDRCLGEEGKAHRFRHYIMHHQFNKTAFMDYDIALIELEEAVEFSERISPICIEPYEYISEMFFRTRGKTIGRVVGCGKMMERATTKTLREVYVPYVTDDSCRISAEGKGKAYTRSMICAGYRYQNNGDACSGDSGGSLTMDVQEDGVYHWVLTGIVSWGVGCDKEGQYGFYTNVGHVYDWIKLHTQLF